MKSDKELYQQLRVLSCDKLWSEEVARFNQASPRERMERVAVIRAVGVVFAANGTVAQRKEVRSWLLGLMRDANEKIRRYAMAAMPKIGAGAQEEDALLALLKPSTGEREKKFLGRALDKIGGAATLEAVAKVPGLLPQTEQKVKASLARQENPSAIRMEVKLAPFEGLRLHLRCRRGLEGLVREEAQAFIARRRLFRLGGVHSGNVVLLPVAPFALADVYTLRCFATLGFALGVARSAQPEAQREELARLITSPAAQRVLAAFTQGSLRYRLEFVGKGHQRGTVQQLANRAYALCPDLLNDATSAPWAMDIHPAGQGVSVELRPKFAPDPRLAYRTDAVDASSHPPLAAAMARLAGPLKDAVVWDPFCGAGLELIERALLGGVKTIIGTDISPDALAIAEANVAAAKLTGVQAIFGCCDFREHGKVPALGRESVTLIISNPPMGRRIRVPNLHRLIEDFLAVAAVALKPGGRLIFPNPVRVAPRDPTLHLRYQQLVDLGGFDCRLELYEKRARGGREQRSEACPPLAGQPSAGGRAPPRDTFQSLETGPRAFSSRWKKSEVRGQ